MVRIPDERKIWLMLKNRAKQKNLEFDLSIVDIMEWTWPVACPILNRPMDYKHKFNDCSPSIDRIDSGKGYTKNNIQIISWKANRIKNNATEAELKEFAKYYSS